MTTTISIVIVAAVAFVLGRWYGRAERADIARIVKLINSIPAVVIQTCPPNCPDCAANRGADAELDDEIKSNG